MKNTLWVFGDSFTYGDGCHPGNDYYEWCKDDVGQTWDKIVADHFNVNVKNFGVSGNCNELIFDSFFDVLDEIRKDDMVSIGITSPLRQPYYNPTSKQIEFNVNSAHVKGQFIKLPDAHRHALVDYLILFYNSMESLNVWEAIWGKRLNNISNMLTRLDIKNFNWKVKKYQSNYESISRATRAEIDDYHWSFSGHESFAKEVIKQLELKYFFRIFI